MNLRWGRKYPRVNKTGEYISEPVSFGVQQNMATEVPTEVLVNLLGLTAEEAADPAIVRERLEHRLTAQPDPQPDGGQQAGEAAGNIGRLDAAAAEHNTATIAAKLPAMLKSALRTLGVKLPIYEGHGDVLSPTEFIAELERYAASEGIKKNALLDRAVPTALKGRAQRLSRNPAFSRISLAIFGRSRAY